MNLNERFNYYLGKEGNERNIYDNRINDNNRKDSEFVNNILNNEGNDSGKRMKI